MGFRRWLKSWGALIVAVLALGLAGFTLCIDNTHYQELIKPHTQFDEIRDRLVRLDDKIERAEQDIIALQDAEQDISVHQENLRQAIELRDQAELAWDKGNYTEADRLIEEAHNFLQELPTPAMNWWLIGAIILGVAMLSMTMLMLGRKKSE